jgi:hypothetical protein
MLGPHIFGRRVTRLQIAMIVLQSLVGTGSRCEVGIVLAPVGLVLVSAIKNFDRGGCAKSVAKQRPVARRSSTRRGLNIATNVPS